MPRAKSNLREEEEKVEEEGGTFAEKGAVVNPRVSTSRFQSFPSLLGIENTRPILIADNDDKSLPILENLPVIHAQ